MDSLTILRMVVPFFGAGSVAWIAYFIFRNIRIEGTASRHLREFQGETGPSRQEQLGEKLAGALPISRETWQAHLVWAKRGGFYPGQGIGSLTLTASLYGGASLVVFLIKPVPVFLFLPILAALYPFLAMRSKANRVRRQVVRALPEIAALVAAEVSAGNPPEQALTRAGQLPGPLSGLIGEAVAHSRKTGRPLFSRKPVLGALVETFHATNLPPLRAFASQVDMAAHHGVESAELMTDVARGLAREYHERVMVEKELLGSKLTTRVAFFFFFPAVAILLMAFLIPVIQMF